MRGCSHMRGIQRLPGYFTCCWDKRINLLCITFWSDFTRIILDCVNYSARGGKGSGYGIASCLPKICKGDHDIIKHILVKINNSYIGAFVRFFIIYGACISVFIYFSAICQRSK